MPVEEGTGKSAGFIVVNLSPDVCRSPTAPIPYNIIAFLSDGFNTSEAQGRRVNFQGFPAFNMKSRVTRSFGDTPGVGLGLGSAAVQGWCRPITPVVTVNCNGTHLCRHEHTQFEMNCLGPEGPGNTTGKVIYLGIMLPGSVPAEGGVPPAANPPLDPDTPKEPSFLDKIKDSLKIESVKDAVDLARHAYDLAQVDWSNPSAALGALAGMAGRAGLGDVATAINLGKKALETDWSDPVKALQAAAGMAGDAWSLGKSIGEEVSKALAEPETSDEPTSEKSDAPEKIDAAQGPGSKVTPDRIQDVENKLNKEFGPYMQDSQKTDASGSSVSTIHPDQASVNSACGAPSTACHLPQKSQPGPLHFPDKASDHVLAHELVHRNASPAFRQAFGGERSAFNEGVTDYFASQISGQELGPKNNYNYEKGLAKDVRESVGEDVLRRAFFGGDPAAIARVKESRDHRF